MDSSGSSSEKSCEGCLSPSEMCGREPFQTADGCPKIDIDLSWVKTIPICDPADPPETQIPPVSQDGIIIPVPPAPCVCFSNKYNVTSSKKSCSDELSLSMSTRSVGDCCNGNYVTDVDVNWPCMPFDVEMDSSQSVDAYLTCGSSPEFKLKIGVEKGGCGDAGGNECTLYFKADAALGIPCMPFDIDAGSSSFEFASVACDGKLKSNFSLDIHKGECGSGSDGCRLVVRPDIHIDVPCPVGGFGLKGADTGVVHPSEERLHTGRAVLTFDSGSGTECGSGECMLGVYTPKIDLNVPCAIDIGSGDSLGVFDTGSSTYGDLFDAGAKLSLKVDDCALTGYEGVLNIPCPFPQEGIKLSVVMKTAEYANTCDSSSDGTVTQSQDLTSERCSLNILDPFVLTPKIPCALEGLSITPGPTMMGDAPGITIEKTKSPGCDGDCEAGFSIGLTYPVSPSITADKDCCGDETCFTITVPAFAVSTLVSGEQTITYRYIDNGVIKTGQKKVNGPLENVIDDVNLAIYNVSSGNIVKSYPQDIFEPAGSSYVAEVCVYNDSGELVEPLQYSTTYGFKLVNNTQQTTITLSKFFTTPDFPCECSSSSSSFSSSSSSSSSSGSSAPNASSSQSSGTESSGNNPDKTGTITAVTSVVFDKETCGIVTEYTTYTINFTQQTVTSSRSARSAGIDYPLTARVMSAVIGKIKSDYRLSEIMAESGQVDEDKVLSVLASDAIEIEDPFSEIK